MSLLTKEQLQIVNGIKAMIADYDYKTDQIRGLFDLVSIIDDLQARHIERKQYTENELYDIWLKAPGSETGDDPVSWDGALWAAKFLGALKAEP